MANLEKALEKLTCQFLSCVPLKCFDWQNLNELTWDEQKQLLDATVAHKLNQQLPVKLDYQTQFLKKLIQLLEQQQLDIHDEIYERFCNMQTRLTENKSAKFSYKHYILRHHNTHFTLRESLSFVMDGTTGLCSWQAALVLANYLLKNPQLVQQKNVLELGTGTGLCGFIIMRCCAVQGVFLTDGSERCVALLHGNIVRNFPEAVEETPGIYKMANSTLAILKLPWNHIASYERTISAFETDVLLAADVVYDDEIFDELVDAIDFVFTHSKRGLILYLAATVRNPDTLHTFLQALTTREFTHKMLPMVPEEECEIYWDTSTPINIYEIIKKIN